MTSRKIDITRLRRHMKARRAIRALAAFGVIISILLIAFESVSLGFGISNGTALGVNDACQTGYCYTGAGLWSGISGIIASCFGLIALRRCNGTKTRNGIYFVLCLFTSICDAVALLLGWTCDIGLFDCLRYHQETQDIDRSLKIMAIMYSCLILEVFVHMVASNASIGFALYNCCLPDPHYCDACDSVVQAEPINISLPAINNFDLAEKRLYEKPKTRFSNQTDFNTVNYTQSLPRYVVLSRPTVV